MQLHLTPGKYVVAVSGGVDSVVLLDMLQQLPRLQLTVAHYDHGIRKDSAQDRRFVRQLADDYGLPFMYDQGKLGPQAGEAVARAARYAFLRKTQQQIKALQIVTAHHQDDLIETAILNMLRGTGRKGLTSLASTADIARPLLHISKQQLIDYATAHDLQWREDSTNNDLKYRRNYVRQVIMPKLNDSNRKVLLSILESLQATNQQLDTLLVKYLHKHSINGTINRQQFSQLPANVGQELLVTWLRENGIRDFDKKGIRRLVNGAQTKQTGTQLDILHGYSLRITKQTLALQMPER